MATPIGGRGLDWEGPLSQYKLGLPQSARPDHDNTTTCLDVGAAPQPDYQPFSTIMRADARNLPLQSHSVDLIVTSPPYWRKRDYKLTGQIGQEETVQGYVATMLLALREWRRVLRSTGSVFINIGDTYHKQSLAGVPARIEAAARDDGWLIRNRFIWTKTGGMPEPTQNRLAGRHEYILHLAVGKDYYYDKLGYSLQFGNGSGSDPGDVWQIGLERNTGRHLAPFPEEIVERAIYLACPSVVCASCGKPHTRLIQRTTELDPQRPQARRAMELAKKNGLTGEHLAAIRATGISDAGKALHVQNGTGKNTTRVKELAAEAKAILGGYFREFTFGKLATLGWTTCACGTPTIPGVVLDPFAGTGTSLRVSTRLSRSAIGVDLAIPDRSWQVVRRLIQEESASGILADET